MRRDACRRRRGEAGKIRTDGVVVAASVLVGVLLVVGCIGGVISYVGVTFSDTSLDAPPPDPVLERVPERDDARRKRKRSERTPEVRGGERASTAPAGESSDPGAGTPRERLEDVLRRMAEGDAEAGPEFTRLVRSDPSRIIDLLETTEDEGVLRGLRAAPRRTAPLVFAGDVSPRVHRVVRMDTLAPRRRAAAAITRWTVRGATDESVSDWNDLAADVIVRDADEDVVAELAFVVAGGMGRSQRVVGALATRVHSMEPGEARRHVLGALALVRVTNGGRLEQLMPLWTESAGAERREDAAFAIGTLVAGMSARQGLTGDPAVAVRRDLILIYGATEETHTRRLLIAAAAKEFNGRLPPPLLTELERLTTDPDLTSCLVSIRELQEQGSTTKGSSVREILGFE